MSEECDYEDEASIEGTTNEDTIWCVGKTKNYKSRNKIKGMAFEKLLNASDNYYDRDSDISIKNLLRKLKDEGKLPTAYKLHKLITINNKEYKQGTLLFKENISIGDVVVFKIRKDFWSMVCSNKKCNNTTLMLSNKDRICPICGSKTKNKYYDIKHIQEEEIKIVEESGKDIIDILLTKKIISNFKYVNLRVDCFKIIEDVVFDKIKNKEVPIKRILIDEAKMHEMSNINGADILNSLFYPLIINKISSLLDDIICDEITFIYIGEVNCSDIIKDLQEKHIIKINMIHISEWMKTHTINGKFLSVEVEYDIETKRYNIIPKYNDSYTLPLINIKSCNLKCIDNSILKESEKDKDNITKIDKKGEVVIAENDIKPLDIQMSSG